MVRGKALNNEEANQFVGGNKAEKEEEKTYDGSPLQEVVLTTEKKRCDF